MRLLKFSTCACLLALLLCAKALSAEPASAAKQAEPPKVGDKAPDFSLDSVREVTVKLSKLTEKGNVVLVVLRGYPGYQCPICSRQVGELLKHADELAKTGAQVVLVYPGPSDLLKERAKEFIADRTIPKHFHMLLDPDYKFTKAYGLRWDAPRETAYPATFVIARDGKVRYAKISKSHGGRAPVKEVLEAVKTTADAA
ncbi:MAG TPA: redoxin family protein [Pirellulales bacterium]|jgi:peroxiredoxin Q/BCP|nr:redoxin family protein [Pirellulales bacterium]